jgi:hypothetical protein
MTPEQKEMLKIKKEQLCKTPLGQMMNNMLRPLGAMTGGLLGPCCPEVSLLDLKKPADSAEGAAARMKQDEADAKARREAVKYLGTVDCHYWPEAQDALIASLRADRNECVRYEAALSLGRGCCCTKNTVKALSICVSGSDEDGNPSETCERVRIAAFQALNHCLACLAEKCPAGLAPAEEKEKEGVKQAAAAMPGGAAAKPVVSGPLAYYKRDDGLSMAQVVGGARRALARIGNSVPGTAPAAASTPGLIGILSAATGGPQQPAAEREPGLLEKSVMAVKSGRPAPAPASTAAPTTPRPHTVPVEHRQPAPTVVPASHRAVPPASDAGAVPERRSQAGPPADMTRLLNVLCNSAYPEEREHAATALQSVSWQSHPQVVSYLLIAASQDSAATVRVACIRSLVRMNVNVQPVMTALEALRADADPRVQHEAEQALTRLASAARAAPEQPMQRR